MKNVSAAQLVPLLRPLIPQQGHLAAYPSGNMLIISDRASNVSRIMKIIERMDESGDEPIEVIPLHNASATELVRTINQLNQGAGAAEGRRRAGQGRRRRAHQQRADQRREVPAGSRPKRSSSVWIRRVQAAPATPKCAICCTRTPKNWPTSSKARPRASAKAQAGPQARRGAPASAGGGGLERRCQRDAFGPMCPPMRSS